MAGKRHRAKKRASVSSGAGASNPSPNSPMSPVHMGEDPCCSDPHCDVNHAPPSEADRLRTVNAMFVDRLQATKQELAAVRAELAVAREPRPSDLAEPKLLEDLHAARAHIKNLEELTAKSSAEESPETRARVAALEDALANAMVASAEGDIDEEKRLRTAAENRVNELDKQIANHSEQVAKLCAAEGNIQAMRIQLEEGRIKAESAVSALAEEQDRSKTVEIELNTALALVSEKTLGLSDAQDRVKALEEQVENARVGAESTGKTVVELESLRESMENALKVCQDEVKEKTASLATAEVHVESLQTQLEEARQSACDTARSVLQAESLAAKKEEELAVALDAIKQKSATLAAAEARILELEQEVVEARSSVEAAAKRTSVCERAAEAAVEEKETFQLQLAAAEDALALAAVAGQQRGAAIKAQSEAEARADAAEKVAAAAEERVAELEELLKNMTDTPAAKDVTENGELADSPCTPPSRRSPMRNLDFEVKSPLTTVARTNVVGETKLQRLVKLLGRAVKIVEDWINSLIRRVVSSTPEPSNTQSSTLTETSPLVA